jgi:AraC-like DNA-binding protein
MWLKYDPILNNLPTRDVVDEQFKSDLRKNIVNHIDDTEYSSDLLAKDMGMSKNTLTSRIKRTYGIFPVELINRIRIQAATELLTQTELTISEIAYRVGFNDPKYFSRVYKKMTGFSPTDIRTKNGSRQHAIQD